MPIKDQNNLTIVRAAAGKLIPENFVEIAVPIDLSPESIISITAPNDLAPESSGSVSAPNTIPSESVGSVSPPIDLSAETAGQMSAPNDLTTVPELRVGGAVLLCSNSMQGVGITISPNANINNIDNAFNFNTFERATIDTTFSGNTTITVFFDQVITADTISISVHNLGSSQSEIINIFSDSSGVIETTSWTPDGLSPANNDEAIVVKVAEPVLVDEMTITLNKIAGPEVFIGNIIIGERLELPPIYGGHAPTSLNRKTRYESNTTGTGNWVGRSIKKTGYQGSFSFQHMDPLFVRDKVVPVLDCIERHPFVIQWRPDRFSGEAVYCWTADDPQLSNMGGGHDLMQMSLNVEAYRGL